ncbi:hypothetical protein ADIARSV_0007 [Arcticibacter svalbardensis MN12-7]|uniref:Uncharacterized protein n=1 Tax=Arcticibacter svalbardensis MN12-7 TaxID=1150600 RepID=R9H6G2_9SPHI|nr:hypothetical protein [Arcticibacter svalbardensis]EOR96744.1 hypothetical protein ADIARSV_0007 [Arcticibacter svalbardensis MN12-7]
MTNAIPNDKVDAVHNEVAAHINDGLKTHAAEQGGIGGLLSSLTGNLRSGSPITSAISGGLVGSLGK